MSRRETRSMTSASTVQTAPLSTEASVVSAAEVTVPEYEALLNFLEIAATVDPQSNNKWQDKLEAVQAAFLPVAKVSNLQDGGYYNNYANHLLNIEKCKDTKIAGGDKYWWTVKTKKCAQSMTESVDTKWRELINSYAPKDETKNIGRYSADCESELKGKGTFNNTTTKCEEKTEITAE